MTIQNTLNNIFDQYDIEENRVTNAFLQTLAHNTNLLKIFLNKYFKINTKKNPNIIISSQKEPFALGDVEEDKNKIESIPDGWIIIDDEIAIVFESKITKSAIRKNQLSAHAKRIKGYSKKHLCVITPDEKSPVKDLSISNTDIQWIPWREVYNFVSEEKDSQDLSGYLRDQLKEYLTMKEDLIGFQGIDYPMDLFNPREAKIILKNLIKEIKPAILKIYPKLEHEKKSYSRDIHPYTVFHRDVWSFLGADENFTKDLHLTFWLAETHMGMGITVPNGAGNRWKRLKKVFKNDAFFHSFVKKLFKLRRNLPNLYLEFIHRHYLTQKVGIVDGIIEIDLDTVKGKKRKKIKANERWLAVLRELVKNKKGYNGQLMLKTRFFYEDHLATKEAAFKDTVIETANSFKEIYDYLQE